MTSFPAVEIAKNDAARADRNHGDDLEDRAPAEIGGDHARHRGAEHLAEDRGDQIAAGRDLALGQRRAIADEREADREYAARDDPRDDARDQEGGVIGRERRDRGSDCGDRETDLDEPRLAVGIAERPQHRLHGRIGQAVSRDEQRGLLHGDAELVRHHGDHRIEGAIGDRSGKGRKAEDKNEIQNRSRIDRPRLCGTRPVEVNPHRGRAARRFARGSGGHYDGARLDEGRSTILSWRTPVKFRLLPFLAAAALPLAGAPAPARAEQANLMPATMAIPVTSLGFMMEFVAQDMHFYEKHGLAMKTSANQRPRRDQCADRRQRRFCAALGRVADPRRVEGPEPSGDRRVHEPHCRAGRAAQGARRSRRLRSESAARQARYAFEGPHHRRRFDQFDHRRLSRFVGQERAASPTTISMSRRWRRRR